MSLEGCSHQLEMCVNHFNLSKHILACISRVCFSHNNYYYQNALILSQCAKKYYPPATAFTLECIINHATCDNDQVYYVLYELHDVMYRLRYVSYKSYYVLCQLHYLLYKLHDMVHQLHYVLHNSDYALSQLHYVLHKVGYMMGRLQCVLYLLCNVQIYCVVYNLYYV